MPLYDKIMLRKRNVIESVNDMLKNVAQIVHTRHRKKRNLLLSFALESESSNKKSETCVKPRFKVGKRRHLAHGLPSSNKKKRNLLLSFALESERGDIWLMGCLLQIKKSETCVKTRSKVGKRRHLAHGLPSSNKKSETYY